MIFRVTRILSVITCISKEIGQSPCHPKYHFLGISSEDIQLTCTQPQFIEPYHHLNNTRRGVLKQLTRKVVQLKQLTKLLISSLQKLQISEWEKLIQKKWIFIRELLSWTPKVLILVLIKDLWPPPVHQGNGKTVTMERVKRNRGFHPHLRQLWNLCLLPLLQDLEFLLDPQSLNLTQ